MSILSQIIAYSPNKIDTETKAKGLLLAEGPRSEIDNFNTPDLEQSPDSFLRPGETLEDFDVEFRRPNAEGGSAGRMGFNEGLKVPKYPDLRMFPPTPNETQAKAKTKVLDKFKKNLKKYILKEIKDFKKTALPKEKYQLIENAIHRAMGYDESIGKKPGKSVIKYVREAIDELPKDNTWEFNKTGKGEIADSSTRMGAISKDIKDKIKPFFRKNYKNMSVAQMAERLTNKIGGHPLHAAVRSAIFRYRDFLIEKNVIKETDVPKGMGGAEGVKKLPPKAYADYKKEYLELAKKANLTDDPRFFATRGKSKGKFGYWKFDDYMKNTMLNMDKIRNALSPNFPTLLLPSFEHTMGVKPGLITGDTSALKKVELQTKKYNFGAIDGMGARSGDFRRVQANLKSATKELKAGNIDAANKSLAKVNEIYNNVAEKFNLNRKGLPNYNVNGKNVLEVNIKEVSKAEKPRVSAFNFFDKVANQASQKEMKVIKKSDPKVFGVLEEFQGKRNVKKINNLLSKFEAFGCNKAAGGRILFGNGGEAATACAKKGIKAFIDDLKKGNYSKATMNILKSGGGLVKGLTKMVFDPNMLKLRNLIGPTAMGFMGLYETGVITDDVIRQGTPLNESLANNWLTKSFLPYTQEYAKAKNLLKKGKVPSNMKKYVEDVVTFNEGLKEVERIENMTSSRLVDVGGYGMGDSTSMYSKEKEDKDVNKLIEKMSTISEDVVTPGTAKALEMKSLQDESEATRMAKKEYRPIIGFDKLKDVRTPGSTSFDYIPEETPKDLRPITYKDYEKKELPSAERQYYENKYNIKPRSSLSEYYLPGAKVNVLDELTSKYNMREAAKYPGFFSADSEKFSEGGITGLRSKYEYKK